MRPYHQITLRLEPETHASLRLLAKQARRSVSAEVLLAVDQHLQRQGMSCPLPLDAYREERPA